MNKDGDVLVVDQKGRSWSLPKGHIEKGETARQAAEREVYEESGLNKLHYIKELGEYERYKISLEGGDDLSELKTITMFLFTTEEFEVKPLDLGNQEARWVSKDKVAELLTHKKDKEFFLSVIDLLN